MTDRTKKESKGQKDTEQDKKSTLFFHWIKKNLSKLNIRSHDTMRSDLSLKMSNKLWWRIRTQSNNKLLELSSSPQDSVAVTESSQRESELLDKVKRAKGDEKNLNELQESYRNFQDKGGGLILCEYYRKYKVPICSSDTVKLQKGEEGKHI